MAAILKPVLFSALFLFRIDSDIKREPKDGSDCPLGPSLGEIRNNQLPGIREGSRAEAVFSRKRSSAPRGDVPLTVGTAQQVLAGSRAVRVKGGVSEDFHSTARL